MLRPRLKCVVLIAVLELPFRVLSYREPDIVGRDISVRIFDAGNSWELIEEEAFLPGSFAVCKVLGIAVHSSTNASAAIAPKDWKEMKAEVLELAHVGSGLGLTSRWTTDPRRGAS